MTAAPQRPRIAAAWLAAPGPQAICAALEAAGRRALFVGGCVRDALLGREAADVDLATDAPPEEVTAIAEAAGFRVAPTGIAHGTVTVLAEGAVLEVTTFRRDVATDGRRAVVAFSADLAEDAARRDFTMNALYADRGGRVLDPLGGLADLRAGRVRFVGDPAARIAEDHLRILRFFRFHAWFGDAVAGLDPGGLAACAAMLDGLDRLSRERVGAEMKRLLAAPDPAPTVSAMARVGALERVLPGAYAAALDPLAAAEAAAGAAPSWPRRLAALGPEAADRDWPTRLRLSRAERRTLHVIAAALREGLPPAAAAYRHGREAALDATLIAAAASGAALPGNLETALAQGAAAAFPLRAEDLPQRGPALGAALRRLEQAWIASGFALDKAALKLLAHAGPDAG